ncbi:nitrogen fixation protein NifZ [Dechloromonas sp.]|uniref:nitrogen fixation protein NifZ n=1 Tax=Dechloromonas sp. TaxID=1917218 RepID=UPI0011F5E6B8|nr:nitrogen fixation protein NifZ [Dechloromonas sp.]MBU3695807.1 nitrogen fixation protein NifZ [Dechloromonas sp.]TEX48183.1 MAG: nitrogen fixation protein NifZ [Rhodocyclaceae bacterium]
MEKIQYEVGDMVFAAEDILNDGGMPGIEEEEGLIAPAGMRGVVVHYGVAEMDESKEIYLVQFENGPEGTLGHPVGCLPDELTQEEPAAA